MNISRQELAKVTLSFLERVELRGNESDVHYMCKNWLKEQMMEQVQTEAPTNKPKPAA